MEARSEQPTPSATLCLGIFFAQVNLRLSTVPRERADAVTMGVRKKKYTQALPLMQLSLRGIAVDVTSSSVIGLQMSLGAQSISLDGIALPAGQAPESAATREHTTIVRLGHELGPGTYLDGSLFSTSASSRSDCDCLSNFLFPAACFSHHVKHFIVP
jgi:hypothetical protein